MLEQLILCRGCGAVLKEQDFEQFLLWDSVVVLKELIFNKLIYLVLWECSGPERTDFEQFLLGQCWDRCGGLERTHF